MALPATLGAGFAWGFVSHRERVFPFAELRQLAIRSGLLKGDPGVSLRASAVEPAFLRRVPYLAGTVDESPDRRGVLHLDRRRASPGLTLTTTRIEGRNVALLADLDGHAVRSWTLDQVQALHLVEVLPDGGLLAVDQGRALLRVDAEGRTRWRVEGGFHHAVVWAGGRVVALRSRLRVVPAVHPAATVLDEEIVLLDAAGTEVAALSILEALLASPYAFLLLAPADDELARTAFGHPLAAVEIDLLHANHLEPTGSASAGPEALRRPGGWLVSLRNLHLLAVIDGEGKAVWAWGPGRLVLQHHPTLLPSGAMLLFNNGLVRSEVLEVDPATRRVLWRYAAEDFFTSFGGSCQRLANGNTLITETATGFVFEVTPEGRRVWVWANPDVGADGLRGAVYRARRFRPEELPFLAPQQEAQQAEHRASEHHPLHVDVPAQ